MSFNTCSVCRALIPIGTGNRCTIHKRKPFAGAQRRTTYEHNRTHPPEWYSAKAASMKRAFLLENPRCHECGAKATHVDHTIPTSTPEGRLRLFDVALWRPHCATCSGAQGARIANERIHGSRQSGQRPDPYRPTIQ